ncbi:MAG TPA: aldehyde dehydrogenase family protein [Acidimicrobiales bacterium]|nr:aldehyde dehydrogenase family protein [Acidimicrobiales bacterium]
MGLAQAGKDYRILVGKDWSAGSGGTYDVVNPATEEVVAAAPEATADDAFAAANAARQAFDSWSQTSPQERATLLQAVGERVRERTEELLPLIIAETGATVSVGSALQIPMCASRFDRYARGALQDLSTPIAPTEQPATPLAAGALMGAIALRQPVGVVACITPYNFPIANMAGKVAPALAAGNTVVIKPAPQDPLAVLELVQIMQEAGIPPGVVNVVTGSTPATGAALVESPDVDMISFTGSTGVGVQIYESGARTMKRLLLELGGKGACLVLDDADVKKAVAALVSTWGFHSGQICTAPTRAVVHRSVYQHVVDALAATAPQLQVGDPLDPATVVGPVISEAQRDRIEGYIAIGADEGAEVVVGGKRPEFERGFYAAPTLLAGCTNRMRVAREEIFGPVISVIPFDDDEEAIAISNDSDFGLASYVFSEDSTRAYRVARRLRSGHVGVNTAQRNMEAPFGGFKMSGVGRDGGEFGLHAYSEIQSVVWPG